ncbi:MAG TPA: FHA domain-containing protein [Dehalococcoidia bacterium]|nr:FHA domain-containing protein [Dehalococcoidia bacterium]
MTARLIAQRAEGTASIHQLKPAGTTLGRDETCEIVLPDDRISRQHARISFEDQGYVLRDLGSRNGTYLNGRRITRPEPLRHRDLIGLPGHTLRFDQADETVPWQPEGTPFASIRVDPGRAEVWVNGKQVSLTAKEYLAVELLHRRGGGLVRKEELASHVWPEYNGAVGDYNIDQLIFRLRGKIETEPGKPQRLQTVRGMGYKLVTE